MDQQDAEFNVEQWLGKQVTLQVTAHNAKAGAVIMTPNESIIYVRGYKAWPKELLGQKIEVEGTLSRGSIYPEAKVENGAMSQGLTGEQFIIDLTAYRRIS